MKFDVIQSARDIEEDITSNEKNVLMVLASHSNKNNYSVWIGQKLLIRKSRLSERTVRKALDGLEKKGLLRMAGYTRGTQERSQIWEFTEKLLAVGKENTKEEPVITPAVTQSVTNVTQSTVNAKTEREVTKTVTKEVETPAEPTPAEMIEVARKRRADYQAMLDAADAASRGTFAIKLYEKGVERAEKDMAYWMRKLERNNALVTN